MARDPDGPSSSEADSSSVRVLNQYVTGLFAACGGLAVGLTLGWSSLANYTLRSALGWELARVELVASGAMGAGISLGALAACLAPPRPRYPLALLALGWLVLATASFEKRSWAAAAGRALTGLGSGLLSVQGPVHIAETSSPGRRGPLLFLFHLMLSSGLALAYGLAAAQPGPDDEPTEPSQLRAYSLGCAVACLPALLVGLLPASPPRQLALHGPARAELALRRLGWSPADAHAEQRRLLQLHSDPRAQRIGGLLLERRLWARSCGVVWIVALVQLCGTFAAALQLLPLLDWFWDSAALVRPTYVCALCGLLAALVSLLAVFLVAAAGPKLLVAYSAALMALSMATLGLYFWMKVSYFSWLPFVCMAVYFFAYNAGVGPGYWYFIADSFPDELRLYAASIITCTGWLICFTITNFLDHIIIALSMYSTSTIFVMSACCVVVALISRLLAADIQAERLRDLQRASFLPG